MRTFYGGAPVTTSTVGSAASCSPNAGAPVRSRANLAPSLSVRIALYRDGEHAPQVEDVASSTIAEHIESVSVRVYEIARAEGGGVPQDAIREVIENLVHAGFKEPVVSVFRGGSMIRVSDAGPGIADAHRAMLPGFTTADTEMKRYIRGVGSGLPLACESLRSLGGSLVIDRNLGGGAVVTLSARMPSASEGALPDHGALTGWTSVAAEGEASLDFDVPVGAARLSARQKRVLAIVMEAGEAGPSVVARELGIGLSTAHRDLAFLESVGLMASGETGKRALTDSGRSYLEDLLTSEREL